VLRKPLFLATGSSHAAPPGRGNKPVLLNDLSNSGREALKRGGGAGAHSQQGGQQYGLRHSSPHEPPGSDMAIAHRSGAAVPGPTFHPAIKHRRMPRYGTDHSPASRARRHSPYQRPALRCAKEFILLLGRCDDLFDGMNLPLFARQRQIATGDASSTTNRWHSIAVRVPARPAMMIPQASPLSPRGK